MRTKIFDPKDNLFITPIQCGEEKCAGKHEFGGIRPYFLVHIVLSGKGSFLSEKRRWELKKGNAFLIYPGVKHLYIADRDEPWHYFWIAFQTLKPETFRNEMMHPKNPVFFVDETDRLFEGFSGILSQKTTAPALVFNLNRDASIYSLLAHIFSGAVRSCVEKNTGTIKNEGYTRNARQNHLESMLSFIESNFKSRITVSDVIEFVRLERSYASRIFVQAMHFSIGEYMTRLRLDASCDYLKQGLTIKETAYSVGYKDYQNFLKAFKKHKGMTPGKF